jgi:hypothetical protein
MGDLLAEDFSIAVKDTLYRCLDFLVRYKDQLFEFLHQRRAALFGAKYDVLLYDLTSTYFESDPPFPNYIPPFARTPVISESLVVTTF